MKTASVVAAALICCLHANAEANWSFVWVGATADGWKVVRGQAEGQFRGKEIHFDLVGENGVKYLLDAQVKERETIEAGFAAGGSEYFGITILNGNRAQVSISSKCKIDVLRLHNELNTLTIGDFGKCK